MTCVSGGTKLDKVCSYHDIVEYLNIPEDGSRYKITRPVRDHTHATLVELDVILVAILSVVGVTESVSCLTLTLMITFTHDSFRCVCLRV